MSTSGSSYIHGHDPGEQVRLTRLNELLNQSSLREMALTGRERILDVGSGLGQLSRAIARTGAQVVGIERSPEQLTEALRQAREEGEERLVEFRLGDAMALPLAAEEWGGFDLAHARFMLEHVCDPLAVVRQMLRAVRPGGRIVLADDDHEILRLWPPPAHFQAVWEAYMKTYERLGNDPLTGRRLVELLHQAGASPKRNTWIFFGSCAGHPDFPTVTSNLMKILWGAQEAILATGLPAAAFDDGVASLQTWSARPDAAFWFAMSWAEGIRPHST